MITELSREVEKYQQAHSVASESNQTLHEAMRIHVVNLQILMEPFPELLKSIPSVSDAGEFVFVLLCFVLKEQCGRLHPLYNLQSSRMKWPVTK